VPARVCMRSFSPLASKLSEEREVTKGG